MIGVYVGANPPSSSMYLVGEQMVRSLGGKLCSKVSELKGCDRVINLVVEETPELCKARRFGLGRLYPFMACNFEELRASEVASLLLCLSEGAERLVVHSRHSLDQITRFARKTFSHSLATEILNRTRLVLWAVEDFGFTEHSGATSWTCPFNRVNQTQKDVRLHHELTSKLAMVAKIRKQPFRCDFVFGGMTSGLEADLSAYRVVQQGSRQQYRQIAAGTDAFLCTSKYESFGIYVLELMLAGAVGVFAKYPWVEKLLPGYELIVPKKDLLEACTRVMGDYPRYRRVLEAYLPKVRELYSFDRFSRDMMAVLDEAP